MTTAAWLVLAALGLAICIGSGCGSEVRPVDQGASMPTRPLAAVLAEHSTELMALPGVVGVFEGQLDDGTPCIGVLVTEAKPEITAKIPARLEGYPVKIEASGEIRPMNRSRGVPIQFPSRRRST
jgi:hypothetical protein